MDDRAWEFAGVMERVDLATGSEDGWIGITPLAAVSCARGAKEQEERRHRESHRSSPGTATTRSLSPRIPAAFQTITRIRCAPCRSKVWLELELAALHGKFSESPSPQST